MFEMLVNLKMLPCSRLKDVPDRIKKGGTKKDLKRGLRLEPKAIKEYELRNEVTVTPAPFYSSQEYGIRGKPDGLVGEEGMIEVKCPRSLPYGRSGIPPQYYAQIQGYLLLSGRQWCDYVVYVAGAKSKVKTFFQKKVLANPTYWEDHLKKKPLPLKQELKF